MGKLGDVLGNVTSFISDHKGPPSKDAKLLYKSGQLIMGGLIAGIGNEMGALEAQLGTVTSTIAGTTMPALTAATAAGAASGLLTPGGGTSGPAVVITEAHFHDEADIDLMTRTVEFAVLAGRV
jgi:hypothetical protein